MNKFDSLDSFSYQCGVIDAFNEVVKAGVKRIALSHPTDTLAECQALIPFSEQICRQYGNHFYVEQELMPVIQRIHGTTRHKGKVPGGSALRITGGQHQMVTVQESPLEEKKRLLEQGAYQGEARKRIAVEYGRLLSYSDEAIERYIRQNDEKED